jgi:hypothetical protein
VFIFWVVSPQEAFKAVWTYCGVCAGLPGALACCGETPVVSPQEAFKAVWPYCGVCAGLPGALACCGETPEFNTVRCVKSWWAQRERETAICITFLIISSDKRPSRAAQPSQAQPIPSHQPQGVNTSSERAPNMCLEKVDEIYPSCGWDLSERVDEVYHSCGSIQAGGWGLSERVDEMYPSGWMRYIRVVDEIYPSECMKSIRVMDEIYPIPVVDEIYPSGWMRSIWMVGWDLSEWGIRSILVGDKIYPRCGWDVS